MAKSVTPSQLKKLALSFFKQYPRIRKISFFFLPKPKKDDHILLRLRYKNDNTFRASFLFDGGFPYHQEFESYENVLISLHYVNLMMSNRLSELSNVYLDLAEYSVPEHWREFDRIDFDQDLLQKFLNLS